MKIKKEKMYRAVGIRKKPRLIATKIANVKCGCIFYIGDQTWLKMQDMLPSGIPIGYTGVVTEDYDCCGEQYTKGQVLDKVKPFNCVRVGGFGNCGVVPEWLDVYVEDASSIVEPSEVRRDRFHAECKKDV